MSVLHYTSFDLNLQLQLKDPTWHYGWFLRYGLHLAMDVSLLTSLCSLQLVWLCETIPKVMSTLQVKWLKSNVLTNLFYLVRLHNHFNVTKYLTFV